ncbi:NUDIX domain-containing protein [Candidatus Saccharibacteria bacterium]|nr:NUDIX domain-containing protein [Candidatus Saccharibacteria bacterium]
MHTDELWQVFDTNGERISSPGYKSSLGNPKKGTTNQYIGAASVWLYRRTGSGEIEILFQQRSPKVKNGGLWDVSAGGHINNNERVVDAAVRELYEEIGAKARPDDLEFIFHFKTFFDVQMFINYFLCDWTGRPDDFNFDDGEVSQVKWVKLADFNQFIDKNAKPPLKNGHYTRELTKYWLEKKQADGNLTQ